MSSTGRRLALAAIAVCGLLLLPLAVPGALGLGGVPGYLHLLSFRLLTGTVLLTVAAVVAATLLRRRPDRRPRLRPVLAVALAVVGVVNVGTTLVRGASGSVPAQADLVVAAFNTQGGAASAEEVAAFLVEHDVAVAGLPETLPAQARQMVAAAAGRGVDFQVFLGSDGPGPADTTALLVRTDLGAYRQEPTPPVGLGAARAVPVSGDGPAFTAVHALPPFPTDRLRHWQDSVQIAADLCRWHPDTVVLGDFNATLDHPPLRDLGRCADAATAAGRGAEGTWPAGLPAIWASPIDHVLYDWSTTRAVGTWTVRVGGSDHRAVVALLGLTDRTETP